MEQHELDALLAKVKLYEKLVLHIESVYEVDSYGDRILADGWFDDSLFHECVELAKAGVQG